jgi:hypothetical protein
MRVCVSDGMCVCATACVTVCVTVCVCVCVCVNIGSERQVDDRIRSCRIMRDSMVEFRNIRITIELRDKGKHRTITWKKSKLGRERIKKKEEK